MIAFGEGYYCNRGFFSPGQSVTTGGIESIPNGYKKSPVLIVRPHYCIEADKIYQAEAKAKLSMRGDNDLSKVL
jgi:hypothetical protein